MLIILTASMTSQAPSHTALFYY
uniref:Uncharacterized protein n=1 Tax=Anguilla anguilla TaxID=7936 RepID=A0A0E9T3A4_ANGAN